MHHDRVPPRYACFANYNLVSISFNRGYMYTTKTLEFKLRRPNLSPVMYSSSRAQILNLEVCLIGRDSQHSQGVSVTEATLPALHGNDSGARGDDA